MDAIKVGQHFLGLGHPCFIIAEAGVNHNGSLEMARWLVDAAAEAGADAVKFQTFRTASLVTPEAPKAAYQRENTGPDTSQWEMLKQLELSAEDFQRLQDHCESRQIVFLSTPFDEESADFLTALGVPAFKVSSGEVTNHPFLRFIAHKRLPILLSTGMCYLSEVDEAVQVIRQAGNQELALLHCVSCYPAQAADSNLRAMSVMRAAFQVPVGYSDHTLGMDISLAAVALGACVLEKHLTVDRNMPGPDHRASLEPGELRMLVQSIRRVEQALGDGQKIPVSAEEDTRRMARRSLILKTDVGAGEVIAEEGLSARRPTGGIAPNLFGLAVGRRATRPLKAGDLLQWKDLA